VAVTDGDTITINSTGGAATFAQRAFDTEIGREYVITMTGANNPVYYSAGTSIGSANLFPSTILLVNQIGSTTAWTDTFGPGTVNVSSGTSIVIAAAGGSATGVRKSYTVVAGQTYRIKWTTSGITCASAFGTTSGGGEYKGLGSAHDPLGANQRVFLATSTTLFIQFQRTEVGTCTINGLALEQLD
jgi:hypothetical protein